MEVISEDGSPHGPKCFVLWNPPLTVSQQALNKGSRMKMSRTEGRARLTKGGISKCAAAFCRSFTTSRTHLSVSGLVCLFINPSVC